MRRVRSECKLVNALLPKTFCLMAIFSVFSACSESSDSPAPRGEKTELYVSVPSGNDDIPFVQTSSTKTIIGGDFLTKVLWSEKDKIYFYYGIQGNQDALASSELGVYRIYPDETIFTGNITVSAETNYDCFAVYPEPESVSDGNVAVFDLPAVQNGLYDSSVDGTSCDIMVAEPIYGQPLSGEASDVLMSFNHKCHAFRIQVPYGRNHFGMDVKKLKVEFPAEVVGKLSVDMTDPSALPELSEGSSTVWLDLTKVLKESETGAADGVYAWIFTAPVDIDGEVRFTAYSRDNYRSESISVSLTKTLEAGKITPVTLTVPTEPEYSSVMLKVGANNLGEDYRTVTVKAPEGAVFRNGASAVTFERNDAQEYPIEFYANVEGADNLTPMKSGDLTVEFESEHAIVSAEPISLADFAWGEEPGRTFDRDVPYLLYEDFSGATARDGDNQTEMLDSYNLPGWSASNYSISAGQGLRLHRYVGAAFGLKEEKPGRLDSPMLANLKDGLAVRLTVSFDIGGTTYKDRLGNELNSTYGFGTGTKSGAVEASSDIENIVISYEAAGTGGSYTNLPLHKTVEIEATNDNRLSWRSMSNVPGYMIGTVYVYIDNIKVQIAPEEAEE